MWQAVTDAVGNEARDALWAHPDILPTAADLDDPQALVARLTSTAPARAPVLDEIDQALEDLLRDDGERERPHERVARVPRCLSTDRTVDTARR